MLSLTKEILKAEELVKKNNNDLGSLVKVTYLFILRMDDIVKIGQT